MTDIIKSNSQNSDCDSTQSGKMGPEMGYTEHVPSVICNFEPVEVEEIKRSAVWKITHLISDIENIYQYPAISRAYKIGNTEQDPTPDGV